MASETKHVDMNKQKQEKLDQILRGIAKERKVAVEADLDSRVSYRDAEKKGDVSWGAYSRFLLSDGHTVYVNLRTMTASVSKEVDKFAQAKVEKRLAKQKKAADRKAAKEAKAAEKADVKPVSKAKAKAVVHAAVEEAVKTIKKSKKASKPAEELDGIPVRPVKA
jgi:hypothetical protein